MLEATPQHNFLQHQGRAMLSSAAPILPWGILQSPRGQKIENFVVNRIRCERAAALQTRCDDAEGKNYSERLRNETSTAMWTNDRAVASIPVLIVCWHLRHGGGGPISAPRFAP